MGMRIKALRVSKNMTQQALSERLDVSRSTIAMWEAGKASPVASQLPDLADALDCTIMDLYDVSNMDTKEVIPDVDP